MSTTRPLSPGLDARVDKDPELARLVRDALNASIGESLREARAHAGKSQADVADAMGVTRPRVAQIEAAEGSALSLAVLARYAGAVGCRLDIALVDPATDESVAIIVVADASPREAHGVRDEPPNKARTPTPPPRPPQRRS